MTASQDTGTLLPSLQPEPIPREEKERRRDAEAASAEALLYTVGRYEETYSGDMAAASAHATLAAYWQARIEWEHGVTGA